MGIVEDFSSLDFGTGSVTARETSSKPTPEQLDRWTAAYAVPDAAPLGAPAAAAAQETADAATRALDTRPVVGRGSAGADIIDLQFKLDALGFDLGEADGLYGPKTEAAVRAFQEAQGISVDGVIGPETRQKLDALKDPNAAVDAGSLDPLVRSTPLSPATDDNAAASDSFEERQQSIDTIVTASPGAAQRMQTALNEDIQDARIRAATLDDQLHSLPTDSFSGYVRPALQTELDGIEAQLQDYDRLTGRDAASLAAPGETYAEAPSSFEAVLDPLNSEGDQIEVDLSAEVGVTGKVIHGGVDANLTASVEQTEDGFVIKVDREEALRLGLHVPAKKGGEGADAKATAGIGSGHLIKYEFDTRAEAAEALKDLVITAGDDPRAGFAAAGVENAADIAHGVASTFDNVSDRLLSFGTFGRYRDNPAGDVLEVGTGFVEEKTNEGREAIDAARSRLNAARSGEEFRVFLEANANGSLEVDNAFDGLGLPAGLNADDLGLELSGSVTGKGEATFEIDRDGNISTTVALSQSGEGTVKAGGVETNTDGQASIEYELAFEKNDDGRLVRQGSGDITINFSAGVDTSVGSGIEATTSNGGGFSYTIKADDLNTHARDAVQQALDGDQKTALQTLASVPGELELNVDVGAGARVDGEIDLKNVTLSGGVERTYGTEATFTVNAENGLNGDALAAARKIVSGDIDEGVEIIGNVEGDLSVQNQRATSGELGFEVDVKVANVDVNGTATATDKDDALDVEGITLRDGILIAAAETRDFAAEEADAVTEEIETVHAAIDDRLPGG